ncbi:MAG: hypothetical protein WCY19_01935 [Candidatus Gastranaerophilaceae bacterium]
MRIVPIQEVGSYLQKSVQEMTIRDFARISNLAAIKSKSFAMDIAASGIRSDVTPEILRSQMPELVDTFLPSGELSKYAKEMVAYNIKNGLLPKNATIKDYLNDFLKLDPSLA